MSLRQPFSYKTEPDPHQREALKKGGTKPKFSLLMDPGTGKTKVLLDTAAYWWGQNQLDLLLVIAPNLVHINWLDVHVPLHLSVPHAAAYYESGRRNKDIDRVLASDPAQGLQIITVNTEMLSHKSGLATVQRYVNGRRWGLVLDEAHWIMTPSSKRTRHIWALGESAVLKRIATGTAICTGYENLYAPYRLLDPTFLGARTFTEFKTLYCIERNFGTFRKIVGYTNTRHLFARMEPVTFQADISVLNLPHPVEETLEVPLSDEQRRVYEALREQFEAELASGAHVETPHQLSRLTKLQQVVSGHVQRDDGTWEALPCPRLGVCIDRVGQVTAKSVVWCAWRPDVLQLQAAALKAGIGCATYFGENDNDTNRAELTRWKTDDACRVLFATPAKAGRGLDMVEGKNVVYYSHSFNYEHWEQSRARTFRRGQDTSVVYTDLVAPRTTDRHVLANRSKKGKLATTVRDPGVFRQIMAGAVVT